MSFSIFIAFYDSWDEIEMTAANYAISLVFLIPFLISIICKKMLFTGVLQRNADIFESNIKVRIRQKAEFQRRKMVG